MSQNTSVLNSAKALDISQVKKTLSSPDNGMVICLPPVKPEGGEAFLCRSSKGGIYEIYEVMV